MNKVVVLYAGVDYNEELDLVTGEVVYAFETALSDGEEIVDYALRKTPFRYREVEKLVIYNSV